MLDAIFSLLTEGIAFHLGRFTFGRWRWSLSIQIRDLVNLFQRDNGAGLAKQH